MGLSKKSTSPYASPVVMVKKKDNSFRLCLDFRALNSVTKHDTYPLPRIDETLEALSDQKYYCGHDLASEYWQIKIDEESIEKTAFVTRRGLFEWNVMPYFPTDSRSFISRYALYIMFGVC